MGQGDERAGKTRTRILKGALELLNGEGEGTLSAVGIATALGISPGHLYYHFKGKGEIVEALFAAHADEMRLILEAARKDVRDLESMWTHIQIVFEEIYDLRFFYRGLNAWVAGDTRLAARVRRLLAAMRMSVRTMLDTLVKSGTLPAKDGLTLLLTEQIVMALLFRLNQQAIDEADLPAKDQVSRAALHVMTLVVAHAAGEVSPRRR